MYKTLSLVTRDPKQKTYQPVLRHVCKVPKSVYLLRHVYSSICTEQISSLCRLLLRITLGGCTTICQEIQVLLKLDKHNRHFRWRPMYFSDMLVTSVIMVSFNTNRQQSAVFLHTSSSFLLLFIFLLLSSSFFFFSSSSFIHINTLTSVCTRIPI